MEPNSEGTGETRGTVVVVSKIVNQPVKGVWDVLMTAEGAEIILGPGATFGSKGQSWKSYDGREGVIRSFHPLEEIRFSWHIDDRHKAMVTVALSAEPDNKTKIEITHNQQDTDTGTDRVRDRWEAALERIESECL